MRTTIVEISFVFRNSYRSEEGELEKSKTYRPLGSSIGEEICAQCDSTGNKQEASFINEKDKPGKIVKPIVKDREVGLPILGNRSGHFTTHRTCIRQSTQGCQLYKR